MIVHNKQLEEFGKRLVRHVRDLSMPQCDLRLDPDAQGRAAKRWRAAADATSRLVPASTVIPDCVDTTVFYVLYAMDDADLLHASLTAQNGELVDLSVVGWGEPAGWYAGNGAWRDWYSKERIADRDDYADISAEWGTENIPDDPPPILDELEMPRRAIEELGILLVRHVRDVAIRSCDEQLLPSSNTPTARRWRRIAALHNGRIPPKFLIPDCVDEAILAFLRAIDEGLLPLSFTTENGDVVDLVKDGQGELAAHYAEWRAKYSQQRIAEDTEST